MYGNESILTTWPQKGPTHLETYWKHRACLFINVNTVCCKRCKALAEQRQLFFCISEQNFPEPNGDFVRKFIYFTTHSFSGISTKLQAIEQTVPGKTAKNRKWGGGEKDSAPQRIGLIWQLNLNAFIRWSLSWINQTSSLNSSKVIALTRNTRLPTSRWPKSSSKLMFR